MCLNIIHEVRQQYVERYIRVPLQLHAYYGVCTMAQYTYFGGGYKASNAVPSYIFIEFVNYDGSRGGGSSY